MTSAIDYVAIVAEALREWQRDELSKDFALKTPTTLWIDKAEIPAHIAVKALMEAFGKDHFVTFDQGGWFIEHSAECRLAGTLGTCVYNASIRRIDSGVLWNPAPTLLGRWKITDLNSKGWPILERCPVDNPKEQL